MRARHLLLPFAFVVAASTNACSSTVDETESSEGAISALGADDLPWEVRSRKGETYLPNVFYADAHETQQIMPLTVHGRHQIDRLVYPTIGNPNLYVKSDAADDFMMVLRVEGDLLRSLGVEPGARIPGSRYLRQLTAPRDASSGLRFFAVKRGARAKGERAAPLVADGRDVIELAPTTLASHPLEDVPEPLRARTTIRAVFDQTSMRGVPAGLYDVRMEVRAAGGAIASGANGGAYEVQYNALRVFDQPYVAGSGGAYDVINVTDTQVSHSEPGRGPEDKTKFEVKTLEKLKEFVARVNASTDDAVRNAAFITFNGDLHNGGSPEALRPARVAWTYNDEATAILDTIKELNFPIFLTIGNHDGYVATGQVPKVVDTMLGRVIDWVTGSENGTLEKAIKSAVPNEWPGFDWATYEKWLADTREAPGGKHVDLFTGSYRRVRGAQSFDKGWVAVPEDKRNFILYDGMNQWQRTYGPTYASWSFGKNRYVNLNSYELRQHRRTGWGMYTVNYGGGISQVQAEWLEKELARAEKGSEDVTLIAHHDPRGGHNGKDYPYYFKQIDYRGMDESAKNYVQGEILNPKICDWVPEWARSKDQNLSCLHDGLQEWMRPDPEFDCDEEDRVPNDPDGKCDVTRYKTVQGSHPWYSGYAVLAKLHQRSAVRTMVLGHTHYNSIEVYQAGSPLVPSHVVLDANALASLEAENPFRSSAMGTSDEAKRGIVEENEQLIVDLEAAGHAVFDRARKMDRLQGTGRELAILRLTSNADLTGQTYQGKPMFGFSVLRVAKRADGRNYGLPQINAVRFFLNDGGSFELVREIAVERTKSEVSAQLSKDNPLCALFDGAGTEGCKSE